MKRIRPIRLDDLDALLHMAQTAGTGFTSLPPNRDFLLAKIERSVQSFAADVMQAGPERYLFVLEDVDSGEVGGCCAIEAACGLDEAFYSYRVGLTVHASRELGVYKQVPTLYLSNDLTGTSMLCSLYLRPEFRAGGAGHLLSRSRFLFIANFPQRFSKKVIAELRGVSSEDGRSPFWEGLGRHFFHIAYGDAEHIVGQGNKACIAELMPRHPIYTVLLPQEAQDVLGKVHPQTAPALSLLEREGFRYQGYVDIFDGGPSVEALSTDIHSVRESLELTAAVSDKLTAADSYLIANRELGNYRCVLAPAKIEGSHLQIDAATAAALDIRAGGSLRAVAQEGGAR